MNGNFTAKQRAKGALYEFLDMLKGAAFPFMIQLIFSSTVLIFSSNEDAVIKWLALAGGEIFLIGAYVIFGRANGISAYRKYAQHKLKRDVGNTELKVLTKTGEYAVWKGFVIGIITTVPFAIVQFVQCLAPNVFCEFLLKYAFGWAYYPLATAKISQWFNFIWIAALALIHGGAYILGKTMEIKRQQKQAESNYNARSRKRK